MGTYFAEQVDFWVKQLLQQITSYEESSERFQFLESQIKRRFHESDSMVFSNREDIDQAISSLGDKFIFHGFCENAEKLKRIYEKYMNLSKSDLISTLNVVKFLMCMANSPTKKFEEALGCNRAAQTDDEEISDLEEFLRKGVERWIPAYDDESSDWSSDSACSSTLEPTESSSHTYHFEDISNSVTNVTTSTPINDLNTAKTNLLSHIQSGWFNSQYFRELPESSRPEANTAIRWERHLENIVQGLIPIPKSSIISEYKVMREVLWQLWGSHESFVFHLDRNKLKIKPNVTISSVRAQVFENYMETFLPHIELMEFFRNFCTCAADPNLPDTYRSYTDGVNSILRLVKLDLIELERKVAEQESSMTLLNLEHEIRLILKPLSVLKQMHEKIILDITENTAIFCSTNLLVQLHVNFLQSPTKLHQDLSLTLYLHSVYKYLWVIEKWLEQDYFQDRLNEFPIANKNSNVFVECLSKSVLKNFNNSFNLNARATDELQQDWQMEFVLQEMCDKIKNDGFIKIICKQVLSMGKNVHLLRLLGKLHLVRETTGNVSSETVYEEFLTKVLEKLKQHYNVIDEETASGKSSVETPPKYPVICPDDCKRVTEWDRLENLVDVNDGFLMKAFQPFFSEIDVPEIVEKPSLFEKISSITKDLFPARDIIETSLSDILDKRFRVSGQIVKNLLLTENNLERHFEFLSRVYLFREDFMFFLYQRLFRQFNFSSPLENYTRLTSYFRDQIMDVYSEFCDSCTVKTGKNWNNCRDPLSALHLINIRFVVKWPINIIIRLEHLDMYYEIFEFNMQIKWALYTLGHLLFNQMPKTRVKSLRILFKKMHVLRFKLSTIFSTIHHYVFGFIYPKNWSIFELELDRSHDINSMINTHSIFITTVHGKCMEMKNYKSTSYGFLSLLDLVNKLALMWQKPHEVTEELLGKMDLCYKESVNSIDHFVIPTYYVL